jgi:hypothetical protein
MMEGDQQDFKRYQQNLKKNLNRDSLLHLAYSCCPRGVDSYRYKTIVEFIKKGLN